MLSWKRRRADAHPRQACPWRNLAADPSLVSLVEHELASRLQFAMERGVQRSHIVIDPGFGFGKNFGENYPLLAYLGDLRGLGFPLLAGNLAQILHWSHPRRAIGARCATPRAAVRISCGYGSQYSGGAHIVRVHDVKPAVEAAAVADEVLAANREFDQLPSHTTETPKRQ